MNKTRASDREVVRSSPGKPANHSKYLTGGLDSCFPGKPMDRKHRIQSHWSGEQAHGQAECWKSVCDRDALTIKNAYKDLCHLRVCD